MSKNIYKIIILLLALSLSLSCIYMESQPQATQEKGLSLAEIDETRAYLAAQETLRAKPTDTPLPSDTPTPSQPPPTLTASATFTPSHTPTVTSTATATNTNTPTSTLTSTITPTIPTATPDLTAEAIRVRAFLAKSNILIFEDAIGDQNLIPRLDRVIEDLDINASLIVNTYDKAGDFMRYYESGTEWDLIIISSEYRTNNSNIGILSEMEDHIDNGGALIVEAWNLNLVAYGSTRLTPILERCGIEVQGDWGRPAPPYEPTEYYIYKLVESTLFTNPNHINLPLHPSIYWTGDGGDLLRPIPGSDAKLLAGIYPTRPEETGVLASCLEGRMLLQTFSTHDYKASDTNKLWQNYILYTLTNRFKTIEEYR